MMLKVLILVLIIAIVIVLALSIGMVFFLSDRRANVGAIFDNIVPTDRDIEIRDRKWEDRLWLQDRPYEEHSIKSYDGISLKAKYVRALEASDKCVICVHGFHSFGYKEFSSIGRFYLENGINVLFVDQRGNGESGGRLITYGDREQRDILDWLDYAVKNLKENKSFALHGISMGSATVCLVSDRVSKDYIKYIAADCGYGDQKEQLIYTISTMGLLGRLCYSLYALGCRMIRLYNPNKIKPVEHVENCRIPMIFANGLDDQIVPADTALKLYEACPAEEKKLIRPSGANHTQAFFLSEEYGRTLLEYMNNGEDKADEREAI